MSIIQSLDIGKITMQRSHVSLSAVPVVLCQRRSGTPALETIDGGVVIRPAREGVNCRLVNDGKGGREASLPAAAAAAVVIFDRVLRVTKCGDYELSRPEGKRRRRCSICR